MYAVYCLLLGVIQGAAEFLPISSSGHLALFQDFFGGALSRVGSITAFSVLLHLGTLLAVLIFYRKDLIHLIAAAKTLTQKLFSSKSLRSLKDLTGEERMLLFVCIGTLPLVALKIFDLLLAHFSGFSLLDSMEKHITMQPIAVGVILIFNGWMLFYSDRLQHDTRAFSGKNALAVGLFQLFAVLPGLSRSGSTITGGRMNGLKRSEAVRFSFLLSIPAVLGSLVTEAPKLFSDRTLSSSDWLLFLAATALACLVGLLSMHHLNLIAQKSTFKKFSYYCFAVGALAVAAGILKLAVG